MRLSDPTICQRLKIQIQLVGVIQDSNAEQATLYHQILYRVQDHALDLNLPNTTGEALFMFTDNARGPAIVNISRMITTNELSSIIPLEWITDYEKAFPKEQVDVHTTAPPTIMHNSDGMVTTVHFYENRKPVYVSHINGHFIWMLIPLCVILIVNVLTNGVTLMMRIMLKDEGIGKRSYFLPLAPLKDLSLLIMIEQLQWPKRDQCSRKQDCPEKALLIILISEPILSHALPLSNLMRRNSHLW
ncbi:hypothetical protein AHAS_Ahas14G0079500 [Arachis hypogaea]